MGKKNLRRKIKFTTALLVIILLVFGAVGVASVLFVETSFQRTLMAAILGALTLFIIFVTIPVVKSYIKGITASVNSISGVISRLNKYGHIDDDSEEFKLLLIESESEDQFGDLASNFLGMMGSIIANIKTMEVIATGDLTKRSELVSDKDSLGLAINSIVDSLNIMLDDIRKTSNQLNLGIVQFSSAAQSLAQSTSEQSATIEQLLLSVKDITLKSNENAQRSQKATELSGDIRDNAQGGHSQMEKMTQAMDEINSASQSISTVMKAIDDIAFQTNILSLNAAVEAARAGQHGKGFAVVADEVRNLATKSATAASDSNEMISNTLKKSQMGLDIVKDTSASLNTILNGVTDSVSLIDEIARSTEAQSSAIEAIHSGINQFSSVVYQNSATAEQSAAASDEMNIQTSLLSEMVSRFTIDEDFIARHSDIKGNKTRQAFDTNNEKYVEPKSENLFESSVVAPLNTFNTFSDTASSNIPLSSAKSETPMKNATNFEPLKSFVEEENVPQSSDSYIENNSEIDQNFYQDNMKSSLDTVSSEEAFINDESSKY